MAVPFDHIATHDSFFTKSAIGQLQRKLVWQYLEKITPQLNGLEILELNPGAGDDAVLFSEKDFNLVATDVSEEMLKITIQKANQFSMQTKISSQYLDLDSFDETMFDKKFDLIFSNFGGLNCIQPELLQKFLQKIPLLLAPKGRFIGVVMPKFCLWETAYQLLRFRFGKAFRRLTSNEVVTNIHGSNLKTWYYNPSQIKKWTGKKLKLIATTPVGFATPPSYLEYNFFHRKRLLLRLNHLEKKFNRASFLSGMADHFLIDLQLK
jgi:ubiquinone/menaquinone biosynthesis C-methylase UbiE